MSKKITKKDLIKEIRKGEYSYANNIYSDNPEYLGDLDVMRAVAKRLNISFKLSNNLSEKILSDKRFMQEVFLTCENIKFLKRKKSKFYLDEKIYLYGLKKLISKYSIYFDGIECFPKEILAKKTFIVKAIKFHPGIIFYANKEICNDKKLLNNAFKLHILKLNKLSKIQRLGACPDLKRNAPIRMFLNEKKIVKQLIKYSPKIFRYINNDLKKDLELTLIAVKEYESNYSHIHKSFRYNKDILLAAFTRGSMEALGPMEDSFRSDPEVILTAINNCKRSNALFSEYFWDYADKKLLKDKDFVLNVLNSNLSSAYQYIDLEIATKFGLRDLWFQRQSGEFTRLTKVLK